MTEVYGIRFEDAVSDPNFTALLDEYAEESAISGMPAPNCQTEMYRTLEGLGVFHVLASFKDDEMTGFLSLMVSVLPHYGVPVATTESFFVAKAHRKGGAGLRLLRGGERVAKSLGAVGLLVSTPFGGKLSKIMPRVGYRESNRVFFRSLQ